MVLFSGIFMNLRIVPEFIVTSSPDTQHKVRAKQSPLNLASPRYTAQSQSQWIANKAGFPPVHNTKPGPRNPQQSWLPPVTKHKVRAKESPTKLASHRYTAQSQPEQRIANKASFPQVHSTKLEPKNHQQSLLPPIYRAQSQSQRIANIAGLSPVHSTKPEPTNHQKKLASPKSTTQCQSQGIANKTGFPPGTQHKARANELPTKLASLRYQSQGNANKAGFPMVHSAKSEPRNRQQGWFPPGMQHKARAKESPTELASTNLSLSTLLC